MNVPDRNAREKGQGRFEKFPCPFSEKDKGISPACTDGGFARPVQQDFLYPFAEKRRSRRFKSGFACITFSTIWNQNPILPCHFMNQLFLSSNLLYKAPFCASLPPRLLTGPATISLSL